MTLHLSGKELKYLKELLDYMNKSKVKGTVCNSINRKIEKALKPIKISSRKGKGRKLQQQVCKDIARIFNIEYNQQDDNCLIHSREMGQQGKDIILRGEMLEKFPYCIECKSTEKLNLYKAIEQAKNNITGHEQGWMVIHKKKNKPILITLRWSLFLSLYADLLDHYYP